MIAVLYRWKLRPGREAAFAASWSAVTTHFRAHHGSLGSRLHRDADGVFYAYAQWRSAADREAAFADESVAPHAAAMNDAIETRFEPVILEILEDQLIFGESTRV